MGKIGEAYVEVSAKTQEFDKGLDDSRSKLESWVGSAQKLVAAFVISKVAGDFLSFLGDATKAASDLAESTNKASVAFGSAFPKISAFAEDMATRFGIVKSEIYDITAGLGFMLTNAGLTRDKVADLVIELTKAAADVSSIQNIPIGVVLEKMRSGISGEAEPLRTLGVNVSEENVKKQAAAMGMVNKELTDQEKILARIALIVKGLSYAQGDLEKTINGYANAARRLEGEWKNLKATIGESLAEWGAASFAGIRDVVSNPKEALKNLYSLNLGASQKRLDKALGVNSAAMTAPAAQKASLQDRFIMSEIEKRAALNWEAMIGKPGRRNLANMAQAAQPLKDALARAAGGPLGGILGGLLSGGIGGAVMGAARGGMLNKLLPAAQAPIGSHIMGGADFHDWAQERVLSQDAPAKQTAQNTKQAVAELKDLKRGITDLARAFTGGVRLRGPS